jgi:hypothetical protein
MVSRQDLAWAVHRTVIVLELFAGLLVRNILLYWSGYVENENMKLT